MGRRQEGVKKSEGLCGSLVCWIQRLVKKNEFVIVWRLDSKKVSY